MQTDILFIVPPSPRPTSWSLFRNIGTYPILGIGYLSAVLENHRFTTAILNAYLGIRNRDDFMRRIASLQPKIVGFTSSTDTVRNALQIAEWTKKINPAVLNIIGGPHVTFMDRETLSNENIDIVVRNEGEETLLEVAESLIRGDGDIRLIKGITYRSDNGIVRNPPRQLIQDLDTLPLPKRTFSYGPPRRPDSIGLLSSRGCPNRCIFCAAGAMAGGRYRMRSASGVFDEVSYHYKKGYRVFEFYDDTITADLPRLHELCDRISRLPVRWSAESRADVIREDPDIFRRMAMAGCESLQFGIESGSQEMLDKICKGTRIQEIEDSISSARKENIRIFGSMMIGHPEDTMQTVRESIRFACHLQRKYETGIIFGIATPFPGTALMNHADELGIEILTNDYNSYHFNNPVIRGKYLTDRDRRNLLYEACHTLAGEMPESWKKIWSAAI